jgi:hypothetical protein
MTPFRQVSWLADHHPSPPSQALLCKTQWHLEKGSPPTVAGAASDLACRQQNGEPHRIPFWLVNATSTPELDHRTPVCVFCQWPSFILLEGVTF